MRTRNPKRKSSAKASRSEAVGSTGAKAKKQTLSVEERIAELAIKSDKDDHENDSRGEQKIDSKEKAVNGNETNTNASENSAEKTVVSQEHLLNEKTVVTEEKLATSEKTDNESQAASASEDKDGEGDTEINSVPIEIEVEESSSLFMRSIVPVVIGIIVGFLTGLSVIYYSQNGGSSVSNILGFLNISKPSSSSDSSKTPVAVPSVSVSEAPVTPTAVVNEKDLYDIKILNGSGKGGEAARLEGILKGKDYSILEIGNASASNFKETVVEVKKNVSASFLASLKKDLGEIFDVADDTEELDEDEESDVIITIGSSPASSTTESDN